MPVTNPLSDLEDAKLQRAITDSLSVDLLKAKYRTSKNLNSFVGHCYVASETYFHLVGGKAAGYKPMFIKHEDEPHWFIQHESGKIIDLTAQQFKTPVPYEKARGCGFLTKNPSSRAVELIRRVGLVQKKNFPDLNLTVD